MTDLLIGAADLYNWDKVKTWVLSARRSGFMGDIALLCYRVDSDVCENASKYNVKCYGEINYDAFGQLINHNDRGRDTQCHQLRFFHAWQLLAGEYVNYTNVIMTDVRDVMFQKNPSEYLQQFSGNPYILASSESITYGNEVWNMDNMIHGFGSLMAEVSKPWTVCNVGVLAGTARDMKNLFLTIYNYTYGRYIPSDQSTYNILLNHGLLDRLAVITTHEQSWACQCGVTLDPEKAHYQSILQEPQPIIKDGLVYNFKEELFTIVHQWDRIPGLKNRIENAYK